MLDGNELADSVHDKRCAIEGAKIAILSAVHQPVGSVNGRTALAQLAAQDGERFFEAALEILERMPDSSTERGTVHSKLCDCPAFLIQLTRPDRFSRSKLLELCRNFIQFDKRLDVRLADLLPHRHEDSHHLSPDSIAGILDVLNEISAGPRLVLLLNHLTDYPDPVVAERAVVLMGRRIQNSSWSQRFLTAQDEGMRASAVESMWGRKSPAARTALWGCVNDTSSQVAGKAVFGLHLLGESGIDEIVTGMLDDTRPSFRSTAAEVMGKIGREEYAELLMKATTDIDPGVRLEAKRALVNIRRPIRQQEAAAAAALPDLPVSEPPVLALPLESPALDLPVPEPPVLATPLESPAPELPLETPRREPQFEIHLDGRYTGRR